MPWGYLLCQELWWVKGLCEWVEGGKRSAVGKVGEMAKGKRCMGQG